MTDRGEHRVYAIDDQGQKTIVAGNGTTTGGGHGMPALSSGLDQVRGIFFHPQGGYFLATHKGGQIWYVDDGGILHLFVDGDGSRTRMAVTVSTFHHPARKSPNRVRLHSPQTATLSSLNTTTGISVKFRENRSAGS